MDAYDRMIEMLAIDHSHLIMAVIPDVEKYFEPGNELLAKFMENYDKEVHLAIKNDRYDHLGEIYIELQSGSGRQSKGQFLTPQNVCDMMAKMTIEDTKKPINVLDPACGTGRFSIAVANVNPNAHIYGVDIDNRAIQTAICNACIFKIHGFYLHGDSIKHIIDLKYEEGRKNWMYANKWVSHYSELIPISHGTRTLTKKGSTKVSKTISGKLDFDIVVPDKEK